MFFKRVLPIGIILLAVCLAVWRYNKPDCLGNVQATLQQDWSGQNPFIIKVERRPDRCAFFGALADSFYVFKIKNNQSQEWREIMIYRHDDPISLRNEFIHIINENVAYIFIFDKFAVTTDGGNTWEFWDANKDLADWKRVGDKYPNWATISVTTIDENGVGKMYLQRIDTRDDKKEALIQELRTIDFGKTWIPQK